MTTPAPTVTDHDGFERQLLELRKREKAHTARATRSPRPGPGCP
jgi:hypothetical protein